MEHKKIQYAFFIHIGRFYEAEASQF